MQLGTLFKHRYKENTYGLYIGKSKTLMYYKIYIIKDKRWMLHDDESLLVSWIKIEVDSE